MKNISNVFCAIHSAKIILSSKMLKRYQKVSAGHIKNLGSSFVFDVPKKNNLVKLDFLKKNIRLKINISIAKSILAT